MIADEQGSSADLKQRRQVRSILLMVLGLALVMTVFITTAPWLKATLGAPTVVVISVALCVIVLSVSEFFAHRFNRGLDEVQMESQRFATRWGAHAGQLVFILLLILPPFQDFATSLIRGFVGDADMNDHDRVVTLAMVFGFGSLVLLQTIGTFVFNIIWWKRSQR